MQTQLCELQPQASASRIRHSYHVCRHDNVSNIVHAYSENTPCAKGGDCKLVAAAIIGDALDTCSRRRRARWLSARMPTFVSEWRWRLSCRPLDEFVSPDWGAFHESELPFIFPPFANCRRTPDGEALSAFWASLLDSLLTAGEPGCAPSGHGECVAWPAYNAASGHTMVLGNHYDPSSSLSTVVSDAGMRRVFGGDLDLDRACDLWDTLYWLPDGSNPENLDDGVSVEAVAITWSGASLGALPLGFVAVLVASRLRRRIVGMVLV